MAGSNLMLKPNDVLFKEGENADGMYLVRKGELQVYLEKDGNSVKLASIGPGGMIGEMAFFDQKPRSASVKATTDAEVTKITNDDFSKLMKQIPKWFMSLMGALSTRLRQTNERLQKLENSKAGAKAPYEDLIKILYVLTLLWHRDGTKENKSWCVNRATVEKNIEEIFGVNKEHIKSLFQTLVNQKIFTTQTDNYKNVVLAIQNRGVIENLVAFIKGFLKAHPNMKCLPEIAIGMLDVIKTLAEKSAYDTVILTLDDVVAYGKQAGLDENQQKMVVPMLKGFEDILGVTKVASGLGFRVNKKEISHLIELHRTLAALAKDGIN